MNVLVQLAILFGFAYAGHILANAFAFPLPASVTGLLLLLAALRLRLLPAARIGDATRFLGVNMAFFFLPSAVEILESYMHVGNVLAELLFICLVSTLLTFLATYASARCFRKILAKRGGQ